MRCIYYLSPTLKSTQQVSDDLHSIGVDDWFLHIHSKDESGLVKEHFQADLFSGHLFVFFNRRRDYVKILMWNIDGLALWSKRLESGTFEKLVCDAQGYFEIDSARLVMMLRGIQIEGTRRRKRYSIESHQAA